MCSHACPHNTQKYTCMYTHTQTHAWYTQHVFNLWPVCTIATVYVQIFKACKFRECHKFSVFTILLSRITANRILQILLVFLFTTWLHMAKDITYYFKQCSKFDVLKLPPDISQSTILCRLAIENEVKAVVFSNEAVTTSKNTPNYCQ